MSDERHVFLVPPDAHHRFFRMRYRDPISEKVAEERSTGTAKRAEALKLAGQWEAALNEGRYCRPCEITWSEFRTRYEAEKLAALAPNTQQAAASAMNHLERVLDPNKLRKLSSAAMSLFQSRLRQEGMKETTIAAHFGHLRSALSWAVSVGLLREVPNMRVEKRAKGRRQMMRGRPITQEEFERMLGTVPKIRKRDPGVWQQYLTGLWLSGLRLEESLALSWDAEAAFAIDLSRRHPQFRIYAEAHKGARDQFFPMTPDFAEFILGRAPDEREGRVFRVEALTTGLPMSPKRVSRTVSAIGEAAGVVVNKAEGKFATAHDLRRSFGTRWAPKVKPATLQKLMRHSSITTTMTYYVDLDADDVAGELWAAHEKSAGTGTPKSVGGTPGGKGSTDVQYGPERPESGDDPSPFGATS